MAIWGTLDMVSQQLAPSPRFAVALAYLREALDPASAVHARVRAVPVGETQRVDLADGVFALEQVYMGKAPAAGRLEAHDRHVDLQAMVVGVERMDLALRRDLTVTEDALADRDLVFFADTAEVSSWRVRAGEIAVFFPQDAHKPSLAVDPAAPALAHKTVVKVRL